MKKNCALLFIISAVFIIFIFFSCYDTKQWYINLKNNSKEMLFYIFLEDSTAFKERCFMEKTNNESLSDVVYPNQVDSINFGAPFTDFKDDIIFNIYIFKYNDFKDFIDSKLSFNNLKYKRVSFNYEYLKRNNWTITYP